MVEIVM